MDGYWGLSTRLARFDLVSFTLIPNCYHYLKIITGKTKRVKRHQFELPSVNAMQKPRPIRYLSFPLLPCPAVHERVEAIIHRLSHHLGK